MTKEEIQKKIEELGIIAVVGDVSTLKDFEEVIKTIEETNDTPQMIAAPLIIDGETNREFFNTKEKIIEYLDKKVGDNLTKKIIIMKEILDKPATVFLADTHKEQLNLLIKEYLTYNWVEGRIKWKRKYLKISYSF